MEGDRRLGPQREVTAPFRYYLRVRYIECDAQKVVFNSRYSEYVDVAINEFLRAIGVLDDFVDGHLDFQLVKQTIEWKAPARFDQVLELSIAATRLGTTSFTVGTEFRIAGGDGRVIVTVETVYVLVDAATLTKLPLPDGLRAALEQGAAGSGHRPRGVPPAWRQRSAPDVIETPRLELRRPRPRDADAIFCPLLERSGRHAAGRLADASLGRRGAGDSSPTVTASGHSGPPVRI